jgi:hypothetical protein
MAPIRLVPAVAVDYAWQWLVRTLSGKLAMHLHHLVTFRKERAVYIFL